MLQEIQSLSVQC